MVAWNHLYNLKKSVPLVSVLKREMCNFITQVSIIIPVHNGVQWLNDCLQSIKSQTALSTMLLEVSVFDDSSTDGTAKVLTEWSDKLEQYESIKVTVSHGEGSPKGVGFAKNRAVEQSCGQFLCFFDVDDIMLPDRISLQHKSALERPDTIIGSKFARVPHGSTARFTRWANALTSDQLSLQIYTSHGPTLIMPTWFCSRKVFDRVGGFSEAGQGTPEDLVFFYKHLDLGGKLFRVDETLLLYRYHIGATTFSIHEDTIWRLRIERLQSAVLPSWSQFTIWNAGKQGRKLYNSLHPLYRQRVVAFCDVDVKKIGRSYKPYFPGNPLASRQSPQIPILSYEDAIPPFIICVKLDLTAGDFEKNLTSLGLREGVDYIIFS